MVRPVPPVAAAGTAVEAPAAGPVTAAPGAAAAKWVTLLPRWPAGRRRGHASPDACWGQWVGGLRCRVAVELTRPPLPAPANKATRGATGMPMTRIAWPRWLLARFMMAGRVGTPASGALWGEGDVGRDAGNRSWGRGSLRRRLTGPPNVRRSSNACCLPVLGHLASLPCPQSPGSWAATRTGAPARPSGARLAGPTCTPGVPCRTGSR